MLVNIKNAGNSRKLNFNIENFSKFKSKNRLYSNRGFANKCKNKKKGWHNNHIRDQFQRNAIERGYKNSSDNDIIMISDIDEIPNPKKIEEFNIKKNMLVFFRKIFNLK